MMQSTQTTQSVVRWREVLALLERVLETDVESRPEALRAIAERSPELYPQLLTLLAAERSAESAQFISSAPPIEPEAAAPMHDSLVGQTIGAYRVLRHIGSGGMGQVWLAERADGRYDGQVAIKLLRSFGDPLIAKRFEREGQLLARLQHPNIARLLDAGATAQGQLYLVLEYVDGDRIDRYFDERKLSVADRIRAFLPVCDAVAHAHTQLVVHRDLKPSNILVTRDGTVKLLDFGIAKLLADQNDEQATELTQLAGRAFTPDFAAPEQIRGDVVTTQTDVYALGAILYRLLSGVEPHSEKNTNAASLLQRANKVESPAMSHALAARIARTVRTSCGVTQTIEQIASQRSVAIDRLLTTLKGDLDVVIGKALKMEANERYGSVVALRDDLSRYLQMEPVSARPDNWRYRAKKFIFRHKIGVAASASLAGAIMAGVGGTLWQANLAHERFEMAEENAARARQFEQAARVEADRATRGEAEAKAQTERAATSERDAVAAADSARANELLANEQRANAERFRARADREAQNARAAATVAQNESAKASSVKNFIVELFNTGDINVPDAEARELKVATTRLLNRGTERLKTQLVDQPEVRSELIDTVANLHLSIESPDQAEFLYREQLAVIEKAGKRDSSEAAASWMKIGRALRNQRKYKEAEAAQLQALAVMDRIGDKTSETRARALYELVQMSFWTNTTVSARDTHIARVTESIAILQKLPKSSALSEAWYALGRIHEASGQFLEAANAYERGVAAAIAAMSERHASVAGGRQMRARVLGYEGRFGEALKELRAAQTQFEETVGIEHRYSVDVRTEIAEVLHQVGQSDVAIASLRRALHEQQKLRGESHNSSLRTQRLLGEALIDTGNLDEAISIFRDALEHSKKSATPSKLYEARVLSALGRAELLRGELASSEVVLIRAREILREHNDRYGMGTTALDLALVHATRGERERAVTGIADALALLAPLKGKLRNDYWRARTEQALLAPTFERAERLAAALADLRREADATSYRRAEARLLEEIAVAKTVSGAKGEACSSFASAILLRERLDGVSHASTYKLRGRKIEVCG
jgi:eukaryotic-like serine/threonine-protein kinase